MSRPLSRFLVRVELDHRDPAQRRTLCADDYDTAPPGFAVGNFYKDGDGGPAYLIKAVQIQMYRTQNYMRYIAILDGDNPVQAPWAVEPSAKHIEP